MRCWLFHKWGVWSDPYTATIHILQRSIAEPYQIQNRTCERCKKYMWRYA